MEKHRAGEEARKGWVGGVMALMGWSGMAMSEKQHGGQEEGAMWIPRRMAHAKALG